MSTTRARVSTFDLHVLRLGLALGDCLKVVPAFAAARWSIPEKALFKSAYLELECYVVVSACLVALNANVRGLEYNLLVSTEY